jgi:type VI secretion system protein VasJ
VDDVPATYEELRDRVTAWTAAVPGGAPAGAPAKFDPDYQLVSNEVAKLDMPAGGTVAWKVVVEKGGALLSGKSKDLVIAAYLAHALHVTGGVPGLTRGCVLLVELMERYWDTLFPEPKRLRGRANALQWFVDKTTLALATPPPSPGLAEAEALEAAAVKLSELARARFAELAPAFGAILEVVARLKEQAAPPPPPPAAEAAPAAAAPAAAQAPAPAAAPAPAEAAAPADLGDLGPWLRTTGAALVDVAGRLRAADPADPAAYRLLRTGTWLSMSEEPPSSAEGRTLVRAPPAADELAALAQGQKWADLLQAAEDAAAGDPLWLDPHRLSWQALGGLGPAHQRARAAIVAEVRALVGRLPGLPKLAFSNGAPLADAATRSWLEEEVGKAAGGAPRAAGPAAGEASAARIAEAKELLAAGQVAEALRVAREGAAGAGSERERFVLRLGVARLFVASGLKALALATYQDLDREAQERDLDAWEPALAAECLRGLIAAARAMSEDPRGASPDLVLSYRRLSRLDPESAHDLWP